MNLTDWRAFAAQTKTEQGAIVATRTIVDKALLEDAAANVGAILAHFAVSAARDYYDRDDCEYTYLTPADYSYDAGPFVGWDVPDGMAVCVGRVRVRRLDSLP